MKKHIGFITSWMENEGSAEIGTLEPIQAIQNNTENLTPAHFEVRKRIELVEAVIFGEKFSTLSKEKKNNFIKELKWLVALNAQLGE